MKEFPKLLDGPDLDDAWCEVFKMVTQIVPNPSVSTQSPMHLDSTKKEH